MSFSLVPFGGAWRIEIITEKKVRQAWEEPNLESSTMLLTESSSTRLLTESLVRWRYTLAEDACQQLKVWGNKVLDLLDQ